MAKQSQDDFENFYEVLITYEVLKIYQRFLINLYDLLMISFNANYVVAFDSYLFILIYLLQSALNFSVVIKECLFVIVTDAL